MSPLQVSGPHSSNRCPAFHMRNVERPGIQLALGFWEPRNQTVCLIFSTVSLQAVARSGVIPQHSLCSGHRHHDSTGQGHSGAPVTCCRLQAAPRPDQPQVGSQFCSLITASTLETEPGGSSSGPSCSPAHFPTPTPRFHLLCFPRDFPRPPVGHLRM